MAGNTAYAQNLSEMAPGRHSAGLYGLARTKEAFFVPRAPRPLSALDSLS